MATIEKLIKAFEVLRVFQPSGTLIDDTAKKKEQPVSRKDKMTNCNIVADCICATNMRGIVDFPKFLGIAMETFLTFCDDADADIRMVADECLNRSIKILLETNLGRLQVELYKEIKKNGSGRTLRAALWRFAEMAHLIRPQKCRPYIVNLLPCLARICKRDEESIQETLSLAMQKLCPSLMGFANEAEVKALLKAFLPNLKSSSAPSRRTAASSLVLICQHSRSPASLFNYLLTVLLDMILPIDESTDLHTLIGVILCIRSLIPRLCESGKGNQGMKGSFGQMMKEKEQPVNKDQFLKMFQVLLYLLGHQDHNVVTGSLEAFQQLLRYSPVQMITILTTPGSITKSLIFQDDQEETLPVEVLSEASSFSKLSEDTGLEEDIDVSESIPEQSEMLSKETSDIGSDYQSSMSERTDEDQSQVDTMTSDEAELPHDVEGGDPSIVITTSDTLYSSIEIGDLNEERSDRSNLSQVCSSSQETLLSIQSLSPSRQPLSHKVVSQDMNGNPEEDPEITVGTDRRESVVPVANITENVMEHLGKLTDNDIPLNYCLRVICRRFLLAGSKDQMIPDRAVRVSVKTLALSCVSSIVTLKPQLLFFNLFKEHTTGYDQHIKDVLLFSSHLDPQLKGNTALIIGNLIKSALKEGKGNMTKWMTQFGSGLDLRIEYLVDIILSIVEDESSVAVRMALTSMQICLTPLLFSVHSDVGLRALLILLDVKDNPYWLVKVELLEILSNINFNIINHLETCCTDTRRGTHHYLGKLGVQEKIVNIVLTLLESDDPRVRHCAAQTLVKMIPKLFFLSDHPQQDPVVAEANLHTEKLLSPTVIDGVLDPPPAVLGLVQPYNIITHTRASVESSLSRVVMSILQQLNLSTSRHLTYGCCHALCLLSEAFPATQYAHSWGCGPPTALLPKDSNRSMNKRPPSRSLSSSSTFSLEELSSGSGGGPLTIILSLLTSTAVSLELGSHNDALQFAGNLLAGSAFRSLKNADEVANGGDGEDFKWTAVSYRLLVPLIEQLITHVARLLNCFTHVIDEQIPGPPQLKASLPSLPNAPSLSPIKRKAKGEKDQGGNTTPGTTPDNKSTVKQKEKEKEAEKEKNKKDALGMFYSLPHYMKLYDVLRGAYSNYKVSLDLVANDKFCSLLRTTLVTMSQILEISTLADIGKYADEMLSYLKTTITLEPTITILCVQQLLKALFGTNLACHWEPQHSGNVSGKPGKATRLTGNCIPGLYHFCFTQPYSQFTQSLAGATFKATSQTEQEESYGVLNWLRKSVDRKLPAILKPSAKTDKTTVASYIRLFEPLVIKALKQYTVTSCLELQRQVLDLLSQLIQLRVNYCLLDSDQVFIGFVIKQFELIEEGQIRHSENLIPHVFNFLVMLSYEKYHSKVIINMPKIIQLCDGIMASGLHPTTHAIPALKPIVYDLFLLRGSNKSDVSRDLETQREVVVSMLLRLIPYYQTLDMLVIVLQQTHKESEERWKRLSRQITDSVLPSLTRQQANLDNIQSLEVLHHLFEALAPIVFRPVDVLLKTLLQLPVGLSTVESLQRWMCLVLSVIRVLMAQSKEEVILSRMSELSLTLTVFKVARTEITEDQRTMISYLSPEQILAWFLIQVVGKCSEMICTEFGLVHSSAASPDFLLQLLSQLLLYITHMFQSGLFRKVATAAMQIGKEVPPDCFYGIRELNKHFLSFAMMSPTLTLQWCNILILLNFDDQSLWSEVMQTPKRYLKPGTSLSNNLESPPVKITQCCSLEILRRGGLVLFCDYVCENLMDAEHMTWLVINHVSDLIQLARESPVQDFISAIHRNSAASSLLIQAIHARCENVSKPSLIKKTMKCLEAIHLSQTGALLTLLIDKFLNTHHLSVARICDNIACRRVEMLLADNFEDAKRQLPLEDLDKLLKFMESSSLIKRHARLVSLLQKLRLNLLPDKELTLKCGEPHPLSQVSGVRNLQLNKEFLLSVVKHQCYSSDASPHECAQLLHSLEYADILSVTMTKEFSLDILAECIALGTHYTLAKSSDSEVILDSEGNKIFQEPTCDGLFLAAQLTMMRHINNVINLLPVPHQILTFSATNNPNTNRYEEKLEDIFTDTSWLEMLFSLTKALNNYLYAVATFPWQPEIPAESQCDICRFCVLCTEMINWMLHHDHLPTSEQLSMCLRCLSLILKNQQLTNIFGQKEHVSWVCSTTATVHQLFLSLVVVPGEKFVRNSGQDSGEEEPVSLSDLSVIVKACDQISELVQYKLSNNRSPSLPDFIQSHLYDIVVGLARQPVLNSYSRMPGLVWKLGWVPSPSGEPRTQLPPLPIEYLKDKDVLKEFVRRINTLGWITRQQFEETWMSLLAVLNPVMEDVTEHTSPEEEIERSQCMVVAVKSITALLLQSTLTPVPGNPSNSVFEIRPRDKPLGFLHTRCGKKLTVIRGIIEQEVQNLYSKNESCKLNQSGNKEDNAVLRYMFDNNLERELGDNSYCLGQISVEGIWSVVGALNVQMAESDTTDSVDSQIQDTARQSPQQQFLLMNIDKKERSITMSGLDILSCLQFLLELYGQWMAPNSIFRPPLMLRNEVVKSIVSLSDLFVEREQYDWVLNFLLDMNKVHPVEDELISQYINIGVCKSAAVVGLDSSTIEKVMKMLDLGLRSPHLPSRIATLHGILYMLEAGMQDITKVLVPMATDFLLRNLANVSQTCITSQQYILTMWATGFYIMENYHVDLKDLEFPSKILQLAVTTASGNEESVSTPVYLAILKGLERLLLTDVLSTQDAEAIIKLGVDRLCLPSPQRSLAALGLMFTCMYSGKQYDQYSPLPRDTAVYDFDALQLYQDPESLILAMERVTVLFDRIKKGYPYEARVITRVLPTFLADFFPPQDIMNKIIGEFISSQQPYPQLIAMVVFKVFSNLQQQQQQILVQDWVMLSLSNFTQRTPIAMAMWSLSCFFISASTNQWLRALIHHVIGRMGKMEVLDERIFCLAAMDFYSQLKDESVQRNYISTFQMVSQPGTPYQELLTLIKPL